MAFRSRIIELRETPSTNRYLAELTEWQYVEEGTVVRASYQSEGKGHGGNSWESQAGRNLLFSIYLRPGFLPAGKQFALSKIISLAIRDLLAGYCPDAMIKWPNDVYIGDRKIAGILIENTVKGTVISQSIAGIGVNVNQDRFPAHIPNPTSLLLETGREHDLSALMDDLIGLIEQRYRELGSGNYAGIDRDYRNFMYKYMTEWTFITKGRSFRARITGIRETGEIVLQKADGRLKSFTYKEIEYAAG